MNFQQPLVSVIIPVFRVEKYLRKGVLSIINQTYDNLQIILVDDGSDDGCPAICDEFQKKDSRVLSLHKVNGGLSDARNYGLNYASGKYVYFFDSDDYLEPDAIKKLVETAESEKVDAVGFGYKKVDEDDNILSESDMKQEKYYFANQEAKLKFLYKDLLAYKVGWEVWGRLYKLDIIKRNDLKFEPNKEIFSEDRCFNIYYTLCSENLIFLQDRFYHYLIRNDSIMGKANIKITENLRMMDYVKQFVLEHDLKYVSKRLQYINIALFNHELGRINKNEYSASRKTFVCSDISSRFGNTLFRPLYYIMVFGYKSGIKNFRAFERFLIS